MDFKENSDADVIMKSRVLEKGEKDQRLHGVKGEQVNFA